MASLAIAGLSFAALDTAPALAQATAPITQPASDPFTLTWERVDDLGNDVRVGDRLEWHVLITNRTGGTTGVAYPAEGNVSDALIPGAKNCRWGNLTIIGATGSYTCPVHHVVTEADFANKITGTEHGQFTPFLKMQLRDSKGNTVLRDGQQVPGDLVRIVGPARTEPHPALPTFLANKGHHGFDCHRIPAITTANNGWLLAAWDGRPGGCGDVPNPNSIVQWISKDDGKTWAQEDVKVIAHGQPGNQKFSYSDPSYVVDRSNGNIFMFFVKGHDASFQRAQPGYDGRQVIDAAIMKSEDNGVTWTGLNGETVPSGPHAGSAQPTVITRMVQPKDDPEASTYYSRFAASGEGIQLRYGPKKGRLVQQFTFKKASGYFAVSVFSDDGGNNWQAGEPIGLAHGGMDENKVVELSNGNLMINSRRSDGGKNRLVTVSTTQGASYGEVKAEASLIDPNNNAGLMRAFPDAKQDSDCAKVLLFSNAKSTQGRKNGTISLSLDDGATWAPALTFRRGNMSYSDMTPFKDVNGKLDSGQYGLLFEGNEREIAYKSFTFADLTMNEAKKAELLDTCVAKKAPEPPAPQPQPNVPGPSVPGPQPSPTPGDPGVAGTPGEVKVERISGPSRVETSVEVAKADFKSGSPVAILARADVHADSASAVPLAKHLNAPVLLTQPTVLHESVLAEMKRLDAKKVIIMGGYVAISPEVEAQIVKAGYSVERIAGPNRAATAVMTAETLLKVGKVKHILVADGANWQPNMIAGPAAARIEGVTLLTNGKELAPESAAFLKDHKVPTTTIGDLAKEAFTADQQVTGAHASALSLAVADKFFGQSAPVAGVATTADFADALVGGAHVARRSGPLLLSPQTIPTPVVDWVRGGQVSREVFVYGGAERFTDEQKERLINKPKADKR